MTKHRLIAYLFLGVVLSAISALLDHQFRLPTGLNRSVTTGPGFDGPELEARVIDPRVGLDFLEADPTLPRRFFSVRWDGVLYVAHDRGVDFYGGADDGLVLRVDGRVVLERNAVRGMNTASQNVPLSPGFHELEVEYEQHGGGYRLNLQWAPTSGAPRALDSESLFPSQPELSQVKTNRQLANLRTFVWAFWIIPPLLLAAAVGAPPIRRLTAAALRAGRSLALDHPVAVSVLGLSMVALALRLGYVFLVADYPGFVWVDPDAYTRKARLLTESGSWRWTIEAARYQRDYFKAPLYPVFLSSFSELPNYLFAAAGVEACLAALATVGVFFIGQSLHSNAAGLLAAAAYAVYYPSVASTAHFMQERLYVPLLIASLAVLTRSVTRPTAARTFALAGGLLGLACLARSMPLFLAGSAALWYWFSAVDRRQAAFRIGAFLSGLCVVVVPYCVLLFVETRQVIAIENIGGFGVLRAYPPDRELVAGHAPTTAELIRVLWHRIEPAPLAYLWGLARTALGSLQSSVGRGLEWSWSFPSATTALMAKVFGTHLPLQKWFLAVMLMLNAKKGLSALQLSRDLKVNKNTAWRISMQIRRAMTQAEHRHLLTGIVEMDETYVGGKPRRGGPPSKPGRGTKKIPVIGAVERGGSVTAKATRKDKLKGRHLRAFVKDRVDTRRSNLITDEYPGYFGMSRIVPHSVIKHARWYVDGTIHTNTIESFWALLKRGMFGQFHSVSQKHLQRYVDEFCYRYNLRGVEPDHQFALTIDRGLGVIG